MYNKLAADCDLQGGAKFRTIICCYANSHAWHSPSPTGMQKRAPFVVIEGLDRSGKTTQIALLHSRLESMGIRTQLVKFPGKHHFLFSAYVLLYNIGDHGSPLHDNWRKLYRNVKKIGQLLSGRWSIHIYALSLS